MGLSEPHDQGLGHGSYEPPSTIDLEHLIKYGNKINGLAPYTAGHPDAAIVLPIGDFVRKYGEPLKARAIKIYKGALEEARQLPKDVARKVEEFRRSLEAESPFSL